MKYQGHAHENDYQEYFKFKNSAGRTMETEDDIELLYAKKERPSKCDAETIKDFHRAIYFIDENGNIQVLHTHQKFKDHKHLEEINDYYRLHIMKKIGHPDNPQKLK